MRGLEDKFLTYLDLAIGAGDAGWMDVVAVAAVAITGVATVDVSVLELDGVWFKWPLLFLYMYPPKLQVPFFGPPVVLCHNLFSLAFWHSNPSVCGFSDPVYESLALPNGNLIQNPY